MKMTKISIQIGKDKQIQKNFNYFEKSQNQTILICKWELSINGIFTGALEKSSRLIPFNSWYKWSHRIVDYL